MKWWYWIGIIIAAALAIRIFFAFNFSQYQTSGDSVSYFLTGRNIITKHRLTDQWRTPVYPIIMALPYLLEGKPMPPVLNQLEFMPELWYIRIAQGVAGILSFVLLFFIIRHLGFPDRTAGLFSMMMSVNSLFLFSELKLLTEPFAMLLLLFAMYIAGILLKKVSYFRFIILGLVLIILVFLRPLTILLPVIVCSVLVWHHRTRRVAVLSSGVLIIFFILVGVYVRSNEIASGYRGFSRISDINLLGKINAYKLPVDGVPDPIGVAPYVRYIATYESDPQMWPMFLQRPELYDGSYSMPIHAFTVDTIRRNLFRFTIRSLADIPRTLIDTKPVTENPLMVYPFYRFFAGYGTVYIYLQIIDVLLFIAVPVFCFASFRKRTVRNDGLLLLAVTGMYFLLTATFLSYDDYTRLMMPAQPVMLFVSLVTFARLVKKVTIPKV